MTMAMTMTMTTTIERARGGRLTLALRVVLATSALALTTACGDGDTSSDGSAGGGTSGAGGAGGAAGMGGSAGSGPPCTRSACADSTTLEDCVDGSQVVVDCMAERGQLCEAGACVEPWTFGTPEWSTCPDEPLATSETLAEKAAYYDEIATRLHIHPDLKWIMSVQLGGTDTTPAVPETQATWGDVSQWHTGENDGLWNGLYLASQAYRYAVTRSDDALTNVKTILEGEVTRMKITGVTGIFTRQYIPPGVAGIACPTDDASYTEDAEKDDNHWVQVRDDGCIWDIELDTGQFTKREACGLDEFAGYCWLENVSKDEYAGHMFGLGAVQKLVDDPDVQAVVVDLLGQVGEHLVENKLRLIDWDGRVTEHGRFSPLGFDDFPGFNAAMGMDFLLMAAEATGRADLRDYYDRCMLRRGGDTSDCFATSIAPLDPFPTFFSSAGMYLGEFGCGSNYNNISMHMLSLAHLIWFEHDPVIRDLAQQTLDVDVVRAPNEPRAVMFQNNTLFDFIWASQKKLGPDSDGPAFDAVESGICQLKQFRASQAAADVTLPPRYQPFCLDRFDRDTGEFPREGAERCSSTFVWWGDPYNLGNCVGNAREIRMPTGYLLAYWMGRYYEFFDDAL